MKAMKRAADESPLAQLGERYLRACGVTGTDELTPAVAERMLNLAALGERVLEILRADYPEHVHHKGCVHGRTLLQIDFAARSLGLLDSEGGGA